MNNKLFYLILFFIFSIPQQHAMFIVRINAQILESQLKFVKNKFLSSQIKNTRTTSERSVENLLRNMNNGYLGGIDQKTIDLFVHKIISFINYYGIQYKSITIKKLKKLKLLPTVEKYIIDEVEDEVQRILSPPGDQ
jgi:hypothetical protein